MNGFLNSKELRTPPSSSEQYPLLHTRKSYWSISLPHCTCNLHTAGAFDTLWFGHPMPPVERRKKMKFRKEEWKKSRSRIGFLDEPP